VIERLMGAEMSAHLGYKPRQDKPEGQLNGRNDASPKTVLTDQDAVRIGVPRNRAGVSSRS
jgi:transposase-like protein